MIKSTFKKVSFKSETDKKEGLERIVNDYFFEVVDYYEEENSILIKKNRMFKTMKSEHRAMQGYPDALLITFNEKNKISPFRIEMVEYECHGESRKSSNRQQEYMDKHIIPQLVRFSSSFSIITEEKTRINTINNWIELIEQVIIDTEDEEKMVNWIKKIHPKIKERTIDKQINEYLKKSFIENIGILLIIDELTSEHNNTLKNIVQSFKTTNEKNVIYNSLVVNLMQKISDNIDEPEYSLIFEQKK